MGEKKAISKDQTGQVWARFSNRVTLEHPGREGMEEEYDGNMLDLKVIW